MEKNHPDELHVCGKTPAGEGGIKLTRSGKQARGRGDAQRQEEEAASAMYVSRGGERVLCGSYFVPFEAKE